MLLWLIKSTYYKIMTVTLQHHARRFLIMLHKQQQHQERLLVGGEKMNIYVFCRQWNYLERNGRKLRSMLVHAQVRRLVVMLRSFLLSFRRRIWVFKKCLVRWTWTILIRACCFPTTMTPVVPTNSLRRCLKRTKLWLLLFHMVEFLQMTKSNNQMLLRHSMSNLSHLYVLHHKMTLSNQKSRIIQRVKFS